MKTRFTIAIGEDKRIVAVEPLDDGRFRVTVDEEALELDARQVAPREYHLLHGDAGTGYLVSGDMPDITVNRRGDPIAVRMLDERQAARMAVTGAGLSRSADGSVAVTAPMPGKVVKCLVEEGQQVEEGQGVIVVEAMKMENELRSPVQGTVKKILVSEGDNVEGGVSLVLVE